MNKGFDFWISGKVNFFIKTYWMFYFIIYLLATWLAISRRNPFIFLFVGFLPYVAVLIYKAFHNPLHNLKESMEKIDPEFFQLISQQKSKLNIKSNVTNQKQQAALLYAGLMLLQSNNMDQRVIIFIKNNKRINWSSMISLTIWFFTFIALLFVLFIWR